MKLFSETSDTAAARHPQRSMLRLPAARHTALRLAFALSLLGVATGGIRPASAVAQDRGPVQRIVQGKVTSKSGTALKGSVVYLKDDHTLAIKSFIADDAGGFRFGQLSQNTDYELWAESNGKKSPVKTISSFDSKNSFNIDLKVDTGS